MNPAERTAGSLWTRAFRPFLYWIAATIILFCWQFHRSHSATATVQFTITGERGSHLGAHRALLNGSPFESGTPCGLGRRTLILDVRGYDTLETNLFVGYWGRSLGRIVLKRSRGLLALSSVPSAKSIRLVGSETNELKSVMRESLALPTGDYWLQATFAHTTAERRFNIRKGETTIVTLKPAVAALTILSEPGIAQFRLESSTDAPFTIEQSTPATLPELPVGKYELTIWQGDYRQNVPVTIKATIPTNELKVEFTYTDVTVVSEPTNSPVTLEAASVGNTPVTLKLRPKQYALSIGHSGHRTTNLFVSVSGKEPRTISVELTTIDYAQAMERARAKLSANVPDYAGALVEVDKALKIRASADAVRLKREIQFHSHFSNARQLKRNGKYANALVKVDAALTLRPTDTEALALKRSIAEDKERLNQTLAAKRRAHPQQVFQTMSEKYQYDELFEGQTLQFKGTLDTVRNAIIAALARKPSWNLTGNNKRDEDTSVLQFETKGFGSKHSALVVAGQTADNQVSVYFKIISLSLGSNIQIGFTGISEDSYKPMHPRYVPEARAGAIQRNLARDIQDFRVRIEDEMR